MNTLGAAALSDSIFFVARRREESATGEYETGVEPELHRIARERVMTLWAGGKGIGGADLLMAAVGAGLRAVHEIWKTSRTPTVSLCRQSSTSVKSRALCLMSCSMKSSAYVARLLARWIPSRASMSCGDLPTGRRALRQEMSTFSVYPQGIEIDGPSGLSGTPPSLVEKSGSKFRVRNYEERGDDEKLGIGTNGQPAPLIDVLHRLLWLIDNRPTELPTFLKTARPNVEQLRLITQALCAPILGRPEAKDVTPTPELSALSKLTANWRSLVEGAALSEEVERIVKGQPDLPFFSAGNDL